MFMIKYDKNFVYYLGFLWSDGFVERMSPLGLKEVVTIQYTGKPIRTIAKAPEIFEKIELDVRFIRRPSASSGASSSRSPR